MAGMKRVVSTSFWTDRKTEDFSPEDRLFMLWLLTNPATTLLGIYEISLKTAATQLGWSRDTVKVLLDRFSRVYGIIFYNEDTGEIAIKNYLRHSIVKGGKPVEDCMWKDIKAVTDKTLVAQVFQHLLKYDDLSETVSKVITTYLKDYQNDNDNGNGYGYGYGDSYPESYHDSSHESSPPKSEPKVSNSPDFEGVQKLYNTLCPSLPKCLKLTEPRKKAICKIFAAGYSVEQLENLFRKTEKSSFLTGKVKTKPGEQPWTASIDWLLKEGNAIKVLEGNYDDKGGTPNAGQFVSGQHRFGAQL